MEGSGTRFYKNIFRHEVDTILKELQKHGATVTGDNPWYVDTIQAGVKLKGQWIEKTLILSITITESNWYVPSSKIWAKIDDWMSGLKGMSDQLTAVNISQSKKS
jgi:hypothetical protein